MIFLDESGDDGSRENSSQMFFVVSLISSNKETLKEEYLKILKEFFIHNSIYD